MESRDSASLLVHYRKLIHLRSENGALGGGDFLPLQSSDPAIAAFLRRDGSHAVLVVANLATTPRAGVSVTSGDAALPAARYAARDLLGGGAGAALDVGADGRVNALRPDRHARAATDVRLRADASSAMRPEVGHDGSPLNDGVRLPNWYGPRPFRSLTPSEGV